MSETRYSISEASKMAEAQSHVLRYWEEELHLPIGRNEMGHRYYTRWDIQVFLSIKELKKKGFQLKEINELVPLLYMEKKEEAVKVDKVVENAKSQEIPEQFYTILEKLVAVRLKESKGEEDRYKRLDAAIRSHQQSRKLIAATLEQEANRKRRKPSKKQRKEKV